MGLVFALSDRLLPAGWGKKFMEGWTMKRMGKKGRKGSRGGLAVFVVPILLFTGLHHAWADNEINILQDGAGLSTKVNQEGDLMKADLIQKGIGEIIELDQVGNDISAVITQEGSSDLIARVVGKVQVPFLQEGGSLDAHMSQKGKKNKIQGAQIGAEMGLDVNQIGKGNQANLLQTGLGDVSGFSNSMSLYQEGNDNRVLKQFQRGAYLSGTIEQIGDKNKAIQVLRGTSPNGVVGEIEQIGNNNTAIQCRKSGVSIIHQAGNNLVNVSINASCF
jgi:hypothetical protein